MSRARSKDIRDESFPVASRLLAQPRRRAVVAFYRFARHADDIADSTRLCREEKLRRLDALEAELRGRCGGTSPAAHLRASVEGTAASTAPARRLLEAFRQDARGHDYRTAGDLILYCSRSAVPVGRFLLSLHGEDARCVPSADALCTAHQILNHLQDCGSDYRLLDRVYIPSEWLADRSQLGNAAAGPQLRAALDRCIDLVGKMLIDAAPLPDLVSDRSLRAQAAATLSMGASLARRLEREDPLVRHVRPGPADRLRAGAQLLRRWLA